MAVRRSGVSYADFSGGDCNFVIGCTPIDELCTNCYARALIEGRQGKDFSKVTIYPDKLKRLEHAKFDEVGERFCRGEGSRPIAFVVDLGDIFHKDIPLWFLENAFSILRDREDVDWLVLTKRPRRMVHFCSLFFDGPVPAHIWVGTTVGCTESMWRLDWLMTVNARRKWISIEPLIERIPAQALEPFLADPAMAWVAVGGESGPNRRKFKKEWAEEIYQVAQYRGIPFFFKQGSGLRPGSDDKINGQKIKEFPY